MKEGNNVQRQILIGFDGWINLKGSCPHVFETDDDLSVIFKKK